MDFTRSINYIKDKIKELNLPYFKCMVKKDEKVIFEYRFSSDDKDNDLLRMYSMSKPITAAAILLLYEQGKLDLNDNVSKYIDGFDALKSFSSGELFKTPITIHNLLTMTSGLDYNLHRPAIEELKAKDPQANTIDVCSTFAKDGVLFEAGSKFQYSLSFDVLAAIVEKVSKREFSTFVEENIFKPLGMKDSTFRFDAKLADTAVQEYFAINNNLEESHGMYEGFHPTSNYESGGAGLISSVNDYSLFIDSIANRTNKIIKDSSIDLLSSLYVLNTPFDVSVQEYSKASDEYGYGYGVRVRKKDSTSGIPVGEFGWDGAAGSYSLCDRKNHISIVIGLTIFNWPSYVKNLHIALANEIYKDIFQK